MNRVNLIASALVLVARVAIGTQVADFSRAAVTDMHPGELRPVTEVEVEGAAPYLWYAAQPGTYSFRGNADGDGITDYEVTVKERGFYRFRNPGMRFCLVACAAPVALWFGNDPVFIRPVRQNAKLWYAPPGWHVHLDEFPADRAKEYVSKTGCAFLSPDRFWHVDAFPALSAKAKPLPKDWDEGKIAEAVNAARLSEPKGQRRIVLFNNAFGYRHTGALEAGPVAFGKVAAKIGYELEVVENMEKLGSLDFMQQFDAAILNSTTKVDEDTVPGVTAALTSFVSSGKGLVLLHAAVDAFYKSPTAQEMNGGLLFGHPWSAPGLWSFINEAKDHLINAPFKDKPIRFSFSDEIYQLATPPFSRTNCTVLVSVNMSDTMTAAALDRWRSNSYGRDKWRPDGDYAVSYTKSYGKGRVFYTSFGHDGRAFCDERLAHMALGLQWVLGDISE